MRWVTRLGVLAAVGLLLLSVAPAPAQRVAPATVVIPIYIEMYIDPLTIDFGQQNPGTLNAPSTNAFPMKINITDNSNCAANVTFNGSSDFVRQGGTETFWISNISLSDNSATVDEYTLPRMQWSPNWTEWANIPAPPAGSNSTRYVYYWLDVPGGLTAGTYQGNVTIRALPNATC